MANTRGHVRMIDGIRDGGLGPHSYYADDLVLNDNTAAAANATAINAWLALIGAAGGGTLNLPQGVIYVSSTLDNKYSRVLVRGAGGEYFHDASTTYGTRIVATAAITVLKHRTVYNASSTKNSGGGWIDCMVDGDGVATKLLEVDSVNNGSYDLFLFKCVGSYAAEFKCGVSSTDLAEACDVQGMERCRLRIRQIDGASAQACGGVKFTGSSNANVSMNNNIEIDVQHYNGHGVDLVSADSNVFQRIRCFSAGGTGKAIVFRGPTAANPVGAEHNVILHYTANTTGEAEGTGTAGVLAGITNTIVYLDSGNSTPYPTAGTASRWMIASSTHVATSYGLNGAVAGDGAAAIPLAFAARLSGDGIRIYSGSDAHLVLQSTVGSWVARTSNSSGNFQLARLSGSGLADIANLMSTTVQSGTSYANDAAAAAGGIAIGQFYRNGSVVQCRIT